MSRQTIYVAGYPKSGTTYLTRLLGDVLNSPTGGCMPSEDDKEIATEGLDRTGPYIIRKGHFVLIDDNTGPVVPSPHRLAWKQLTNEKIVFLVRDPRDICVSGSYHWRTTPAQFLERMINGDVARCGRWDEYIGKWEHTQLGSYALYLDKMVITKYEDLMSKHGYQVIGILGHLGFSVYEYEKRIILALERQSFAARSAGLSESEMRQNNMRKGKVGDWRNHFTKEMNSRIWQEFGWMMERLGYEQ